MSLVQIYPHSSTQRKIWQTTIESRNSFCTIEMNTNAGVHHASALTQTLTASDLHKQIPRTRSVNQNNKFLESIESYLVKSKAICRVTIIWLNYINRVAQIVVIAFYRARWWISVFTSACNWTLPELVKSSTQAIYRISYIFHLRRRLPTHSLPSYFACLISTTCPAYVILHWPA
jgi:hypothetical protein